MLETFNKLLTRKTETKNHVYGDPYQILPIKNKKYARECTEVHLGAQGIEVLINFEDFMNLEVLWLNDNQLERLENLDVNFRIKHIYLHNNRIHTLEGSMNSMLYLETMHLYNNDLRDLDKILAFLEKYTLLQNLDLFGNPLAEEPNYRIRVIKVLPWLKVFDRHIVTYEVRGRAKKFVWTAEKTLTTVRQNQSSQSVRQTNRSGRESPNKTGSVGARKSKLKFNDEKNTNSKIEEELFKEVKYIKAKHTEEKQRAEADEEYKKATMFTRNFSGEPPLSTFLLDARVRDDKRKDRDSSVLNEWDTSKIRPLFKAYDKGLKGSIDKGDVPKLYQDLCIDKACIGQIPDISENEFVKAFSRFVDANSRFSWADLRDNINSIPWRILDHEKATEKINSFYNEAHKLRNTGKTQQANELIFKAVRLQNKISDSELVTKESLLQKNYLPPRCDTFDFSRFKFKSTPLDHKEIV